MKKFSILAAATLALAGFTFAQTADSAKPAKTEKKAKKAKKAKKTVKKDSAAAAK
jgi:hypothetical protein